MKANNSDFQMPGKGSVAGRSSSITAAFYQAITPVVQPTIAQINEVLTILGMAPGACVCAYCGGAKTEWDHFRPTVQGREPTGYITEIYNLVPACGKCNQSKGNKDWRDWINSSARLAPRNTAPEGLSNRMDALARFEEWSSRLCTRLDYRAIVGEAKWERYCRLLEDAIGHLNAAQQEAKVLRELSEQALRDAFPVDN